MDIPCIYSDSLLSSQATLLSRFGQLKTDPKDAGGNYRLRNCEVELLSKLGSETVLQCYPNDQSSKRFRVHVSTCDIVDYDPL